MKEVVITILAAILIVYIAKNSSYRKDDPIVITKYDTVYQEKTLTKYTKGVPYVIVATDTTTIHDTITIIKDYNTVRVFTDSFTLDSSRFTIIDTISKNTIQGRHFKANIHEKTIFVTKEITKPSKNEVYLGILGDLRRFDNNLGIGIGGMYKTAKNKAYFANLTTNQISVGLYLKF